MMREKNFFIMARGISGFFFGLVLTHWLAPEFVSRYRWLVVLFFIFLLGGWMHYRQLQRKLNLELTFVRTAAKKVRKGS